MASQAITKPDTKQLDKQSSQLHQNVAQLVRDGIKLGDKERFSAFGSMLTAIRAGKKAVGFVYDPIIASAKKHVDDIKQEKEKHLTPLAELESQLEKPMEEYLRLEREAKAAEQRRINEENQRQANLKAEAERVEREAKAAEARKVEEKAAEERRKAEAKDAERARKAGEISKAEADKRKKEADEAAARSKKQAEDEERVAKENAAKQAEFDRANVQEVVLESTTPAVAGIKRRVNYYAEVVKSASLLFAYDEAVRSQNRERAAFLSRFIQVDEQEVGKYARDTKDPKKVEETLPGVRSWSEDSV